MKHHNPYRINDHENIFEVTENSSHPELKDAKRLWIFGAYTFKSATELERFFKEEGLDPRHYWIAPQMEKDLAGKVIIRIYVKTRTQLNAQQRARAQRLAT